jgi:hypothetical protein
VLASAAKATAIGPGAAAFAHTNRAYPFNHPAGVLTEALLFALRFLELWTSRGLVDTSKAVSRRPVRRERV